MQNIPRRAEALRGLFFSLRLRFFRRGHSRMTRGRSQNAPTGFIQYYYFSVRRLIAVDLCFLRVAEGVDPYRLLKNIVYRFADWFRLTFVFCGFYQGSLREGAVAERLRERAATKENWLECGDGKPHCAVGSSTASRSPLSEGAYGKRCLSCSPFDCWNLFVFLGRRGADPYRVS